MVKKVLKINVRNIPSVIFFSLSQESREKNITEGISELGLLCFSLGRLIFIRIHSMTPEIELAIIKVLKQEERSFGHTAMSENRLLTKLSGEVEQSKESLKEQVQSCESISSRVVGAGSILWSTNQSQLLETQLIEQIERIIKSFLSKNRKKILKSDLRLGKSVSPSYEQLAAVNASVRSGVSIITGGPGTGKTTMIRALVFALKGLKLSIKLCAPTGKAAKRMGEATGLQKFKPETVHKYLQSNSQSENNNFNVMIVDEASMIDVSLLHSLLASIPDGAQLILIGDKDQLPPVKPGQPFRDLIKSINTEPKNLVENTKSKVGVSGIVSAAYSVINGVEPDSDLTLEEDNFQFIDCENEEITDQVLEYYFTKMPILFEKSFDEIVNEMQILVPQKSGGSGLTRLNVEIQKKLTRIGEPLFKGEGKRQQEFFANDRVMQVKNDYEINVMNGEIGKVISRVPKGIKILIDNKEVTYNNEQLENLELAYAISIHKSQGSEYSGVIIPITSEHSFILSRNLVYTAITRGKSKVCLVGERSTFENTIKNSFKGLRNTGLVFEIQRKGLDKKISLTRLTEIYRQKIQNK